MRAVDVFSSAMGPTEACAERVTGWCRRFSQKELARAIGCTERTARALREGAPPKSRHLYAMAASWGETFVEYVFAPVVEPSDADLRQEIQKLHERTAHLLQRLEDDDAKSRAMDRQKAAEGIAAADRTGRASAAVGKRARALGVMLCLIATGTAMVAGEDMRHARAGRYGGRPPMVRVSRGGREA